MPCRVCQHSEMNPILDLGLHAISNRFSNKPIPRTHPVKLTQCQRCSTIQLLEAPSAEELTPVLDWIQYREPEGHLAALAQHLYQRSDLSKNALIRGLTDKDEPLLEAMQDAGFATGMIYSRTALGLDKPTQGIETLQARISSQAPKDKPADLLIARHILEHAHDLPAFVNGLMSMIKPGGKLLLEVPDISRALRVHDYTTAWEEHTLYFTRATLLQALNTLGLQVLDSQTYPYPFEDSLVVLVTHGEAQAPQAIPNEQNRFHDFVDGFSTRSSALQQRLQTLQLNHGPIALFGAGHLGGSFTAFHELEPWLAFAVDDNPNKQGLYLPCTELLIRPSADLIKQGIKIALLALSPEIEAKVIANQQAFVDAGGQFYSIFPDSERAL